MSPEESDLFKIKAKWGKAIEGAGGGWTAVPNMLLRYQSHLEINSSELVVLIHLIRFWWQPDRAPFPSPERIAIEMGISPRSVYRILATLEKKHLLEKEEQLGQATSFHLGLLAEKLKELKEIPSSE